MFSNLLLDITFSGADTATVAKSVNDILGVNLFENSIDEVIFSTNQFVSDATFIGPNGPFWWILQMCMALGALFSVCVAAGMAYKMMLRGEAFDPMKIIRVLGIAIVMFWWYPGINPAKSDWCVLDFLSYIPNAIGSYTHDLYEIEATQVADKYDQVGRLMQKQTVYATEGSSEQLAAGKGVEDSMQKNTEGSTTVKGADVKDKQEAQKLAQKAEINITFMGITLNLDKFLVFIAVLLFRVGWWGTIYCQQIILGMLTIFGPIQWAFSVLPKWEGAWAKWLIRYLTVHFYGAMLYFVGFRNDVTICKSISFWEKIGFT